MRVLPLVPTPPAAGSDPQVGYNRRLTNLGRATGPVSPTSLTLLERLQRQPAAEDWRRLHDLYRPLILQWLARVPGLGDERDDLAQEVLMVLMRELPRFERRREGSFRAWLRQVTINRIRAWWRERCRQPAHDADGFLDQLADPASDLARQWDREHDRQVSRRLMELVQPDFKPTTWEAFRLTTLEGCSAAEAADRLGISANAVLLAKCRVLKRLRTEAGDLLA